MSFEIKCGGTTESANVHTLVFWLPVRLNSVSQKPSRSRYSVFWRGANT